jgi:PKHD-type hydroxylase
MLLHVPNVLTPEQTRELRTALDQALEDGLWIDGRASVGEQGAKVKRNRQLPENSPLAQRLGAVILDALAQNPLFFSAALPLRYLPPMFNRYEGGEHYGMHVDGSVRYAPTAMPNPAVPGGLALRTDLSCTLFLCDPEEYEGGELIVADTYGEHEVKLPAGDLILYPSSSLHRVAPVTRGARVCSFFWLQSMIRDDSKRALLFELDQNIQKLRARIGDCEETVSLTGNYHNLLRLWAEV